MEDDYWHWRVQAAARRELLKLAQILGGSASFSLTQVVGSQSLVQVLGHLSQGLADPLQQVVQRLGQLEKIPTELLSAEEEVLPARQQKRLAELIVQLFGLAVSAIEYREELVERLRKELSQVGDELDEVRKLEPLQMMAAEPPQLPAITGLFSQQIEWAQAQLRSQEIRLDEAQKQARTLEYSLLDKQNEMRFQEFKLTRQRQQLRKLTQRSDRLRQVSRELRQSQRQMVGEREDQAVQLKALTGKAEGLQQELELKRRALQEREVNLQSLRAELQQSLQSIEAFERESQALRVRLRGADESNERVALLERKLGKTRDALQKLQEQSVQVIQQRDQQLSALNEEVVRLRQRLVDQARELSSADVGGLRSALLQAQQAEALARQVEEELRLELADAHASENQTHLWAEESSRNEQVLQRRLDEAEAALRTAGDEVEQLRSSLVAAEKRADSVVSLQGEVAILRGSAQESELQVASLRQEVDVGHDHLRSLQEVMDQHLALLEQKQAESQMLEEKLNKAQLLFPRLKNQASELLADREQKLRLSEEMVTRQAEQIQLLEESSRQRQEEWQNRQSRLAEQYQKQLVALERKRQEEVGELTLQGGQQAETLQAHFRVQLEELRVEFAERERILAHSAQAEIDSARQQAEHSHQELLNALDSQQREMESLREQQLAQWQADQSVRTAVRNEQHQRELEEQRQQLALEHREQMAALAHRLQEQVQQKVAQMRLLQQKEVQQQLDQLRDEHQREWNRVQQEHQRIRGQLQVEVAGQNQQRQQVASRLQSQLAALRTQHALELDRRVEEQQQQQAELEAQLLQMQEQHRLQVARLQEQRQSEMEQLKRLKEDELGTLAAKLEEHHALLARSEQEAQQLQQQLEELHARSDEKKLALEQELETLQLQKAELEARFEDEESARREIEQKALRLQEVSLRLRESASTQLDEKNQQLAEVSEKLQQTMTKARAFKARAEQAQELLRQQRLENDELREEVEAMIHATAEDLMPVQAPKELFDS